MRAECVVGALQSTSQVDMVQKETHQRTIMTGLTGTYMTHKHTAARDEISAAVGYIQSWESEPRESGISFTKANRLCLPSLSLS